MKIVNDENIESFEKTRLNQTEYILISNHDKYNSNKVL